MKLTLSAIVLFLLLSSCTQNSEGTVVRVAGMKQEIKKDSADSLLLRAQDQFTVWMTQTFYQLRHSGLSVKKSWLALDSLAKDRYSDTLPSWYFKLRKEADSLMKEKSRYKKLRLV